MGLSALYLSSWTCPRNVISLPFYQIRYQTFILLLRLQMVSVRPYVRMCKLKLSATCYGYRKVLFVLFPEHPFFYIDLLNIFQNETNLQNTCTHSTRFIRICNKGRKQSYAVSHFIIFLIVAKCSRKFYVDAKFKLYYTGRLI